MKSLRFSNEIAQPIELMVEPWGNVLTIQPGSKFVVHYAPPTEREDMSYAEYHERMIRLWCEGGTYEVDIDGVRVHT